MQILSVSFVFLSKLMSGSVARTGTNVISTHFLANRIHLYLPHINTYLHRESRLPFHPLRYNDHLSGAYFASSMTVLKRIILLGTLNIQSEVWDSPLKIPCNVS